MAVNPSFCGELDSWHRGLRLPGRRTANPTILFWKRRRPGLKAMPDTTVVPMASEAVDALLMGLG